MSSPYRESAAPSVHCPRCSKAMAPGELQECIDGCGAWVTAEAAETVFPASERAASRITSWFRERCDCPACGKRMVLVGHDMSLFQGCTTHGYWIDDSTITQTGMAHPANAQRLERMRLAAKALRDQIAREAEAERARLAEEPRERAKREAEEKLARAEAARKAREEAVARLLALRDANRKRVDTLVRAAVERGDVEPIVDELIRLEDAIQSLANRVTNGGL